jgi:hypothetical protein
MVIISKGDFEAIQKERMTEMKSYWGKQELCMTGKGWEIRHRLHRLAVRENLPGTTLADVLNRRGGIR